MSETSQEAPLEVDKSLEKHYSEWFMNKGDKRSGVVVHDGELHHTGGLRSREYSHLVEFEEGYDLAPKFKGRIHKYTWGESWGGHNTQAGKAGDASFWNVDISRTLIGKQNPELALSIFTANYAKPRSSIEQIRHERGSGDGFFVSVMESEDLLLVMTHLYDGLSIANRYAWENYASPYIEEKLGILGAVIRERNPYAFESPDILFIELLALEMQCYMTKSGFMLPGLANTAWPKDLHNIASDNIMINDEPFRHFGLLCYAAFSKNVDATEFNDTVLDYMYSHQQYMSGNVTSLVSDLSKCVQRDLPIRFPSNWINAIYRSQCMVLLKKEKPGVSPVTLGSTGSLCDIICSDLWNYQHTVRRRGRRGYIRDVNGPYDSLVDVAQRHGVSTNEFAAERDSKAGELYIAMNQPWMLAGDVVIGSQYIGRDGPIHPGVPVILVSGTDGLAQPNRNLGRDTDKSVSVRELEDRLVNCGHDRNAMLDTVLRNTYMGNGQDDATIAVMKLQIKE